MWQCRTATLPMVILLFGAVETSADFLGSLANINPQKIASALSDKIPEDVKAEVVKNKQHMETAARKFASQPAVEAGKQKVAAAIKDSDIPEKVADSIHVQIPRSPDPVAEAVPTTTLPAQPQAAAAVKDGEPVASSPQKATVVNALQTVSEAIEHVGEALNGTKTGAVHDILNGTSTDKVADAVASAVNQGVSLEKAQTGLKEATNAIASSPHADALKKVGQDLADAFHIPTNKVHETLKQKDPQAADWLTQAVKNTDPEKTIHDITATAPKVVDAIKGSKTDGLLPHAQGQVVPADGADDAPVGWLGALVALCLLGLSLAGGWHLFKTYSKRDVRSPTLLADSEMAMWTRTGSQSQAPMQPEEPLFRQF